MSDLPKLPLVPSTCQPVGVTDQRGLDAFRTRFGTAKNQALPTPQIKQTPNGDEAKYNDKSGTYSKGLKQVAGKYGVVDPAVFAEFRKQLGSNDGLTIGNADFEHPPIALGDTRKLNGPAGAFAEMLVGGDSQNFGADIVPPAPEVASKEYAVELLELYWASLLRDVPFTEYATNSIAKDAAKELTKHKKYYAGPLEGGKVTPHVLFRGGFKTKPDYFKGELVGPYISQFCIQPTRLGVQELTQMMITFAPGLDYLTDLTAWQAVQNGKTPIKNIQDPVRRFMHNGRALGAFTHEDELYQAYFVAYLVLKSMFPASQDISNPKSPYRSLKIQQPFGTFGGPDIAATLGAVAKAAINAVWYQKWVIHLRHRPESGGGIVHLMKNPLLPQTQAKVDPLILNSDAVQQSFNTNSSYLLSQAFPEGSPTHPAYPTGHGTVAGACITVLKFFFDGELKIPSPVVPAPDGLSLVNYTDPDRVKMTVNGELHKLAHNISFGHGILAGIHWRSDTDYSLLLGEEVAIRFLEDQKWTYRPANENFEIKIRKMDNSIHKFKNF